MDKHVAQRLNAAVADFRPLVDHLNELDRKNRNEFLSAKEDSDLWRAQGKAQILKQLLYIEKDMQNAMDSAE